MFDHFQFALIHGPDIPGSYAILLFTASDLASITSHIHSWVVFALAPSLYSFWRYFSTDLQQHLGHLPTWGVPLSVAYHFAFSYCSWGSQGKNTEVVCHSLLQWTTFCQTSPPWPARLGWPHMAWLSFIELDKAVVLVWLDWLVFCDYVFSVSALWCPLAILGFLLPLFRCCYVIGNSLQLPCWWIWGSSFVVKEFRDKAGRLREERESLF